MKKNFFYLLVLTLLILTFFSGVFLGQKNKRLYSLTASYIYPIYHKFLKKETLDVELSEKEKTSEQVKFYNHFKIKMKKIESVSYKVDDQVRMQKTSKNYDYKKVSKNKTKVGNIAFQHQSAGFYIIKENEEIIFKIFTRDGNLISNNGIKKYKLPPTYSVHNGKGGIRGVFFFNDQPYGLMTSEKIGCLYASVINIEESSTVFDAGCLPDVSSLHYDGIGGANIHFDDNILLSIGIPSYTSESVRALAQNKKSYYGKIIALSKDNLNKKKIDKSFDFKPEIISVGHRNPQGLAKINKIIFSTEHGPKGGDEINIIRKNNNYGWAVASYGSKYESIYKKSYKYNHKKNNFREPLYQFTPSIGISSLANCPKSLTEYFDRKGCLLVNSLKDASIYVFLLDEELKRVIGYEKLEIGERLRNFGNNLDGTLFEDIDGSIYITTDLGNTYNLKFILEKE